MRPLTLSDRSLPNVSMETRIRCAANAGFSSIGVSTSSFRRALEEGLSEGDIRALLDDQGVTIREVEFLKGWWRAGGDPSEEDWVRRAVDAFDPQHVNIGLIDPRAGGADIATRLGQLRERLRIECLAIEPMPFGAIRRLADAVKLIHDAQHTGVGLVLDTWHLLKSGTVSAEVAAIPVDLVACVQLADVDMDWTISTRDASLSTRKPPGLGEGHLITFIRPLLTLPTRVDFTVEVMARDLDKMAPQARARTLYDAAELTLVRAAESTERP